jgi:hypothetical protein
MKPSQVKYIRHNKQNLGKIQCRTLNGFECMYLMNKMNDYFAGKHFIDLKTKQYLIDYVVRHKNTITLASPKDTIKFLLKEGIQKSESIRDYTKTKIRMRGHSGIKQSKKDAFSQIFLKGGSRSKSKSRCKTKKKTTKINRKKTVRK